jgi:hypothetical protein
VAGSQIVWRVEEDGRRSEVKIEFELYASNFIEHRHSPKGCDYIVCWEDDISGQLPVKRLALRPLAQAASPPVMALPARPKYEAKVWDEKAFLAQCSAALRPRHRDLLAWAKRLGEIVWGKGAKHPSMLAAEV